MRSLLVPNRYLELIAPHGASCQRLFVSCGLPASILTSKDPIPFDAFMKFANAVMHSLEDESCGLLPSAVKPGSFSLLCQSCTDCRTLGHFLKRRIRSLSMLNEDIKISMTKERDQAQYKVEPFSTTAPLTMHAVVIIMALAYKMGSWGIRERLPIESVSLTGPRDEFSEDYENIFGVPIQHNQEVNMLSFPERFLERPILQDALSMKEFLKAPAFNLVSEYAIEKSLASEVKALIQNLQPEDYPSFNELADKFNLSPATLRRRLGSEQVTYQSIKDLRRRDIALSILTREKSVKAAAFGAGFSDTPSFFRAFRRWTGSTPIEYITE